MNRSFLCSPRSSAFSATPRCAWVAGVSPRRRLRFGKRTQLLARADAARASSRPMGAASVPAMAAMPQPALLTLFAGGGLPTLSDATLEVLRACRAESVALDEVG